MFGTKTTFKLIALVIVFNHCYAVILNKKPLNMTF